MSAKRRDRAAPPPGPGEWDVRFGTTEAAKGWEILCQHAAGATLDAWKLMRANPRPPVDGRHKQLRGEHVRVTSSPQGKRVSGTRR